MSLAALICAGKETRLSRLGWASRSSTALLSSSNSESMKANVSTVQAVRHTLSGFLHPEENYNKIRIVLVIIGNRKTVLV